MLEPERGGTGIPMAQGQRTKSRNVIAYSVVAIRRRIKLKSERLLGIRGKRQLLF
jgi:hypothetical protein